MIFHQSFVHFPYTAKFRVPLFIGNQAQSILCRERPLIDAATCTWSVGYEKEIS